MADRDLEFLEQLVALQREGQAFAVAMVVSRRSPVSSHLGDRAIIFPDGRMHGFVGGACSREIVRRQALDALALGRPRLVQIRPDGMPPGSSADAEHVTIPMSCASEGALDIYIEPYGRPSVLLVVGFSPVAEALVSLRSALDHDLVRVVADEERGDLDHSAARVLGLGDLPAFLADVPAQRLIAVVASQGHYDEPALEALLRVRPPYLGLLASRKRGAQVREHLRAQGFSEAAVGAIRNPIGLDLGATTPGEVAVSILAEIIRLRPRPAAATRELPVAEVEAAAIDPVCGMAVAVGTALHTVLHDGRPYYFCCPRCKAAFQQEPGRYLAPAEAG